MIKCDISKVMIDERSHEQMVVLKEAEGVRVLPIIIGIAEASAIRAKLSGKDPVRPISYDLLNSVVAALEAKIDFMLVDNFKDGIFFAKLAVSDYKRQEHKIDARPSDCIALSVRLGFPIFVEDRLLEASAKTHS